ncbi:hypothetical protein GQ44DRAFT_780079 [Phaeosphaeriaceae sp. PMI808]|nr:hypothetical protein GQ44DRAFT_780079 [Phaeosphaeriaceae sp. PMI808]
MPATRPWLLYNQKPNTPQTSRTAAIIIGSIIGGFVFTLLGLYLWHRRQQHIANNQPASTAEDKPIKEPPPGYLAPTYPPPPYSLSLPPDAPRGVGNRAQRLKPEDRPSAHR